jgi:hypothetical protein
LGGKKILLPIAYLLSDEQLLSSIYETPNDNLSRGMRQLDSLYTQRFIVHFFISSEGYFIWGNAVFADFVKIFVPKIV